MANKEHSHTQETGFNFYTFARLSIMLGLAYATGKMILDYHTDPNKVTEENWRDHYPLAAETTENISCAIVGPNDFSVLTPFGDKPVTGTINNYPLSGSTSNADGIYAVTLGKNLQAGVSGVNAVFFPSHPCPDTSYFVSDPNSNNVKWDISKKP